MVPADLLLRRVEFLADLRFDVGVKRFVALQRFLGGIAALGDSYQRANEVSNVLFELLAGGLLFSVLVPSFVELLERRDPEGARALGIRAILLDRDGLHVEETDRIDTLFALPAALGLSTA